VDFVGKHDVVVSDAQSHSSGATDVLYSAFQKVDEDLSESTSKWLQQIGLGSEHAAQFLQHYNEYHYQHTTQCLLRGNFNCYIPTGMTPIRRHFEFPQHLTRFRPESEIISQYRNNRQLLDSSQDQGDQEEQGDDNTTDLDNTPDDMSSTIMSKQSPRKTSKSIRPGPGGPVSSRSGGGDPKKTGKGSRENGKRLTSVKTISRSSDSECPSGGTQKGGTTTTQTTSGRDGRVRLGELTNLVKT